MQTLNKLSKIIFYSFLLFSQLNAFVNFKLMQKDDNMILIIGDAHHQKLNAMNETHIKWFHEFINRHQTHDPIKLIYQMSEETIKVLSQPNLPLNLSIAKTFSHLVRMTQNSSNSNNVKFSPFDCRGKESKMIEDFFSTFISGFTTTPTEEEWQAKKREWSPKTNKSSIIIKKLKFLQSLQLNQKAIQQWRDTFQQDSSEYKMFNEFLSGFKKKTAQISKYLQDKPNIDIRLNLLSLLEDDQTSNELEQKFRKLSKLFCYKTNYIFADLGFINEILKNLQAGFNKIILVVGLAHTTNISTMLEKLGYTTNSEFSIVKNIEKKVTIQCNNLMTLPNKLLPTLCRMFNVDEQSLSQQQTIEAIKKSESIARYCNKCQDLETQQKKLLTCSRCKKVFYCNVACQKAHWPTHKPECIAVN